MEIDLEHVIARPPARVFAVLSDPSQRPRWQENTSDVRDIAPPGPVAVGTAWTETTRGVGDVRVEVAALEQDALWHEAGVADGGRGTVTVRLHPGGADGASTLLVVRVELRLSGLRRMMEPALGGLVSRQMPADMRRLEALISP